MAIPAAVGAVQALTAGQVFSMVATGLGTLLQTRVTNAAIEQQAATSNRNAEEGYRVAQERDRAAQAEVFEASTDRGRRAARELSMARVIAAEGGGSLAARAMNITADAAQDLSSIEVSLDNARSSVRSQMAAVQAGNLDELASARQAGKANQIKFLTDVAGSVGNIAVREYRQNSERETTKDLKK